MLKSTKNKLLTIIGFICCGVGFIGAFVPLLPTTPLFILAAFLFSKSNKKFHNWILSMPKFGPLVREWEDYGVINPKAKAYSTITIIIFFSATLYFVEVFLWVKAIVALTGIAVIAFILTRASERTR